MTTGLLDRVRFPETSPLELVVSLPAALLRMALATLFLSAVAPATAAELQGRVVHVIDGDGLVVLIGGKRVTIRLEHIDAPETGQPHSIASRQSLIAICGGELATVRSSGMDRSGRTLARVFCNGTDASVEQVRRGMAWVLARDGLGDAPLLGIQAEARTARRGLWAAQEPIPPWEWRGRQPDR